MSTKKPEEVIEHKRLRGTIKNFVTYRGFGFITPDGEPEKEVFVHLKDLVGYEGNKYPYLPKGIPVEFAMVKDERGCRAQDVSQPGGAKLVSVDEDPSKNYNKDVLYTGTVRFFNHQIGFGFITADVEEINWGGETSESRKVNLENGEGEETEARLAASVWFAAEEIVGPLDEKKKLDAGDKVQFNVYKDNKGLGAGKILLISKSTKKRKRGGRSRVVQKKKKRESVKETVEIDNYLRGNYRGALQEYCHQRDASITYETDVDLNDSNLFITTARTVGYEDDTVEGTGRAPNKKAAIKAAALDLIFNLGLVSKEEHEQNQDSK